jgi:hypothetical protein
MLEVIVRGIGSSFLQITQNGFGMLNGEVPQEATFILPKLQIGQLNQVLDHRSRRHPPQGGCAHNGKADWFPDPRDKLLPYLVTRLVGAETDNVFQRQG